MQLFAGKFSFCDHDLLDNPSCDPYDGTVFLSIKQKQWVQVGLITSSPESSHHRIALIALIARITSFYLGQAEAVGAGT